MRLVVQRVKQAQVEVQQQLVGRISRGLLVFLGIHQNDKPCQTQWMVSKLINLRIFEDLEGKMNHSVLDIKGEVLVISQFTLYANCKKGRRPDFFEAAAPSLALPIYEKFLTEVHLELGSVQRGIFGANMQIHSINDGPATFILEDHFGDSRK